MKPLLPIWLREGSKVIRRYYELNMNYIAAKVEYSRKGKIHTTDHFVVYSNNKRFNQYVRKL